MEDVDPGEPAESQTHNSLDDKDVFKPLHCFCAEKILVSIYW
jgi:hypothetical protein